jgi:hypothetical protein
MDRWLVRPVVVVIAVAIALSAVPASAKTVGITASPNPARVGERVRHDVEVGTVGRLEVWVSARGFQRPGTGSLPTGTWNYECCPSQTAGTPAWHYRSSTFAPRGAYHFGALASAPGNFLSTAFVAGVFAGVWIRIR